MCFMFNQKNLNNPQPTAATMVVIPQEEWLSLHEKLDRLAELVTNRNADDRNSEWIESDAARKMLGISVLGNGIRTSRVREKRCKWKTTTNSVVFY